MRFWDSSAVVPLLFPQPASPRVEQWWTEDSALALWTMTPVEITSAVWRLVRERAISDSDARAAEGRAHELAEASYRVADVEAVKPLARRLLRVHAMRAADALQLGAALLWAAGQPHGKTLLTLDTRLAAIARLEGFEVP
jgi:predicted nucleic acid-binding protein